MRVVNHLEMGGLEIRQAVLAVLGAAPASPNTGQMYWDSALAAPRWYDGAAWTNKATDSALLGGQNLAYVLGRGNHTGSQTASTISDLATVVQGYRLSAFAAPDANVDMGGFKITGLADPTLATDAATMGYVQAQVANAAAGIDAKPSVRAATTANIALSGNQTIDGVATATGDRVLVKNQTTASENGVWIAAVGAWARATDADGNDELTPGAFWYVEEGTANGKTQWRIENTGDIIVGTTAITINQFGGAGTAYTAGNGLILSGNQFSADAHTGILVSADGIAVDPAVVPRKFSADVGDGAATTITVTHNLNTQDVVVSVRDNSTNAIVLADVVANGVNTVTVTFATAPAANAYRVTVLG